MRPTDLNYRLPKEQTAEFRYPKVTCEGQRVGYSFMKPYDSFYSNHGKGNRGRNGRGVTARHSYTPSVYAMGCSTTFSTQARFFEYDRKTKVRGTDQNVGPGSYTPQNATKKKIKGSYSYRQLFGIRNGQDVNNYSYFGHCLVKTKSNKSFKDIRPKSSKTKFVKAVKKRTKSTIEVIDNKKKDDDTDRCGSTLNSKFRTTTSFKGKYKLNSSSKKKLKRKGKTSSSLPRSDSMKVHRGSMQAEVSDPPAPMPKTPYLEPVVCADFFKNIVVSQPSIPVKNPRKRRETVMEKYSRLMKPQEEEKFINDSPKRRKTYFGK